MALANRVQGLSTEALLDCFISGLTMDLQREVLSQCPHSLLRAVSLAKLFEEKYTYLPKQHLIPNTYCQNPTLLNTNQTPRPPPKPSLPRLLPTPQTKPQSLPNKLVARKMSAAEMQMRCDKGLCFWCDEKFTFNHKCPNRHFMVLEWDDEPVVSETMEDSEASTSEEGNIAAQSQGESLEHHLSLNAMKGLPGVGTIRFSATI